MEELKELKSKAYDLISMLEAVQRELQQVNAQIAELQQKQNDSANAKKPNK